MLCFWGLSFWLMLRDLTLSVCIYIHRYNTYDRALAHAIETQVINWTILIQKILKEDSSDRILPTGCYPGPSAELSFWASRNSNIQHIYHQVNSAFVLLNLFLSPDILCCVEVLIIFSCSFRVPLFRRWPKCWRWWIAAIIQQSRF